MVNILIIDPNAINREVLTILLDHQGYQSFEAKNESEAKDILRKHNLDLIIIDLSWAIVNEPLFINELNENTEFSHIPLVSYETTNELRDLSLLKNVKQVISKPSHPEEIISVIRDVLQKSQLDHINSKVSYLSDKRTQDKVISLNRLNEKKDIQENVNLCLAYLMELGQMMALQNTIEDLIYTTSKGGKQFLDACFSGIILRSYDEDKVYDIFTLGRDNKLKKTNRSFKKITGVLGDIFLAKKSFCIQSPIIELEKIGLEEISLPVSSFLSIPIETKKTCFGTIYFIYKDKQKFFNISAQRYMKNLSDAFAIHYEKLIYIQSLEIFKSKHNLKT